MKKKSILAIFPLLVLTSCGYTPTKINGGKDVDPFDFDGNSLVSELNIDGKADEEQWQPGEYTTQEYVFSYKNKLSNEPYQYSYILYRGINELFVFFKVYDCNICTYGNDSGSSVSYSDSCELYLDTNLDGGSKPQTDDYQIDLGVHGKTRVLVGNGAGWSNWSGIVQYESFIDGTLNDESDVDNYYSIEMSIPYKQIGIKRDQEIGVTLGIVDRYIQSGSQTNKMWYGTTINGHFGSPQVPDAYFILKKNSLELPPVPEYDPSQDKTVYASNFNLKIASTTLEGTVYPEITYKIGRTENTVTVLATTKEKWPQEVGICFLFDFDDPLRGARDSKTIICRAFPGARSLLDFYKYPNVGLDKKILDLKIGEKECWISFNIDTFKVEGYENINFCASSIRLGDNYTVKVLDVEGSIMNQGELKTYGQLTPDNQIKVFENNAEYDPSKDSTQYIAGTDIVMNAKTYEGIDYAKKTIKVSRVGNIVTVLLQNDINWNPQEQMMILLDFGNPSRTVRDGSVVVLRFYPQNSSIHDFFFFPNVGTDKNIPQMSYYKKDTKVQIDISSLVSQIPDYSDQGVGIEVGELTHDTKTVISYCSYNGTGLGSDPSAWPRLSATNTII